MGEKYSRESNERKNFLIRVIIIIILILLAAMSTVIYIFTYPKTRVILYDQDGTTIIDQFDYKKYSDLNGLTDGIKAGHTFRYWSYDRGGHQRLDYNRELDSDVLHLYANFDINQYNVVYYVPVKDKYGRETYSDSVVGCEPQSYDYNYEFILPTGLGKDEKLIPELSNTTGKTFVGWSTEIVSDKNADTATIIPAGGTQVMPEGGLHYYAVFKKNEYKVTLHNGIQYEMEGDTPKKDGNDKYIIKNNADRYIETSIKFLDKLSVVTSITPTLSEEEDGVGALEYDFKGWYLDENYTIPADSQGFELQVDENGKPFFNYLVGEDSQRYDPFITTDSEAETDEANPEKINTYNIHLYSKWERRQYKVTFERNSNSCSGKLEPQYVYKYDDNYGKYYNCKIEFDTTESSPLDNFMKSNMSGTYKYRFVGFTTRKSQDGWSINGTKSTSENNIWYCKFAQTITQSGDSKTYTSNYHEKIYTHDKSEDVTLYAQWKRLYNLTLATSSSTNKQTEVVAGIAEEIIDLRPFGKNFIEAKGWQKDYNEFKGWTTSTTTSNATKYFEYLNGSVNLNFAYPMTDRNMTLYILWEKIKYNITFNYNYDDDAYDKVNQPDDFVKVGYGNNTQAYPSSPTREGYIFDGWSEIKHPENMVDKVAKKSPNTYTITGDVTYYATWTKNFKIVYTNLDTQEVKGSFPSAQIYSVKGGKNLKMNISIGSGSQIKLTGHKFKGWAVADANGNLITDSIISAGSKITFDFSKMCYYVDITGMQTNPEKTYPFKLSGENKDTLYLYAYFERNEFRINLYIDGSLKTVTGYYDTPFEFAPHEPNKPGHKFIGWSKTSSLPQEVDKDNPETIEPIFYVPSGEMSKELVTQNYTFYAIFEAKNITITFKYLIDDGDDQTVDEERTIRTQTFGYKTPISMPSFTLPEEYKQGGYIFTGKWWHYVNKENNEKAYINPGDKVVQDDNFSVYAEVILEQYTLSLNIKNPVDNTIDFKNITVLKSDIISAGYNELSGCVEKYIIEKNLQEYTFGNFYYYIKTVEHTLSDDVVNDWGSLGIVSNTVIYVKWNPNAINIVYHYKDTDNDELHNNANFDSTSIVLSDGGMFTMEEGDLIQKWYIDNGEQKIYFDINKNMFGGDYKNFASIRDYISWDGGVGTLNLYAETQTVFTINYFVNEFGTLKTYKETQLYSGSNNVISIKNGEEFVYGDLIFNGWRLGEKDGSLVTQETIVVKLEDYPDYIINLYADMSFYITYNYLVWNGSEFVINDDKTEVYTYSALDYADGNYNVELDNVYLYNAEELPNGYFYYGVKQGNYIFKDGEIVTVTFDGNNHTISSYFAKRIYVTYTLTPEDIDGGAQFVDNTTEDKKASYLIGFDGIPTETIRVIVDNPTIENYYNFIGWKDGSDSATIYNKGDILEISNDITLTAYFILPEEGTISANFVFKYDTFEYTVEVFNGREEPLLTSDEFKNILKNSLDSKYEKLLDNKLVTGWIYEDSTYNCGYKFFIPHNISEDPKQVYVFTAMVNTEYKITYDATIPNVQGIAEPLSIEQGKETQTSTTKPSITGNNQTVFQHWELVYEVYELGVKKTYNLKGFNGANLIINLGDYISINDTSSIYSNAVKGKYISHFVPAVEGVYSYVLKAVWEKQKFDITINVTNPSTNVTKTETVKVEYGNSLTTSDILASLGISDWITASQDILGWSSVSGGTVDEDILNSIISNKTIYAIWENKYTISFSPQASDTTYAYIDGVTPSSISFFKGDKLNIDASIIRSIFYKGYTTLYLEDKNGNVSVVVVADNNTTTYYRLKGFTLKYVDDGGNDAETTYNLGEEFVINTNYVAIPVFEQVTNVYTVKMYENGNVANKILYKLYLLKDSTFNPNNYPATRKNFVLLGWADKNTPTTKIDSSIVVNKNIELVAIWETDLQVNFKYNNETVFSFSLDNKAMISKSTLETYLEKTSGNFIQTSINGNANTYKYLNTDYYLNGFSYGGILYDIETLTGIGPFVESINVNLMLENIYKIVYIDSEELIKSTSLPAPTYFTQSGVITATAHSQLTVPSVSAISDYFVSNSWKFDLSGNIYNVEFDSVVSTSTTPVSFATLVTASDKYTHSIEFDINWNNREFEVFAYAIADAEKNLIDPYSTYSTSTESDIITKFTNVAYLSVRNEDGTIINDDKDGITRARYNSTIYLAVRESAEFANYTLIGWSFELVSLGTIPANYFSLVQGYSIPVDIDESAIKNNKITLYPVYAINTTSIEASSNTLTGRFSYEVVENTEFTGFVATTGLVTRKTTTNNATINYSKFNNVIIYADSPNPSYEFASIMITSRKQTADGESVENDYIDTSTHTILGATDVVVRVEVYYTIRSEEVTVNLVYNASLKSGTDTSTISIKGEGDAKTLSATTVSDKVFVTILTNLTIGASISEYYVLDRITTGSGENERIVELFMNQVLFSSIAEDNIITIYLSPKTYTVNIQLNGGQIEENKVYYTNNLFSGISGEAIISNSTIQLPINSTITLPTVTREGYKFTGWYLGEEKLAESTLDIESNGITITANFEPSLNKIYYIVLGQNIIVDFDSSKEVVIGYGLDLSGIDMTGKNITGWQGDIVYNHLQSVLLENKIHYLTAIIDYVDISLVYTNVDASGDALIDESYTLTVDYGDTINLPTYRELENNTTWTVPTNKYLYGWNVGGELFKVGQTIDFASLGYTYNENNTNVILTAVYYNVYTYTINYIIDENDSATVIPSETYFVYAINADGGVDSKDLNYRISDTIPLNKNTERVIDGYEVYLSDTLQTGNKIPVDGKFVLYSDANILLYEYNLKATWDLAPGVEIKVYLTDPNSGELMLIDGKDYYSLEYAIDKNKLQNRYLPTIKSISADAEEIEWQAFNGSEYNTFKTIKFANSDKWDLKGYTIFSSGEEVGSIDLSSNDGTALGGYEYITLYSVWQELSLVQFKDANNIKIDKLSGYRQPGEITLPTLEDLDGVDITKDGFELVGFTTTSYDSQNITIASDYYNFGSEYEMVGNTTFYLAFAKVYNVVFDVNEKMIGDRYEIVRNNPTTVSIVNPTINIYNYFDVKFKKPADEIVVAYKFAGYSLIGDKYANDKGFNSSNLINVYELNSADAVDGVITIYAVWEQIEFIITFQNNALYKDNSIADNRSTTQTYHYGEQIDFSIVSSQLRVENFEAIIPDGQYFVEGDKTFTINYNPIYRLEFDSENLKGSVEASDAVSIEIGTRINEFDLNNYYLSGFKAENWYLGVENKQTNFFVEGKHYITQEDLDLSTNDYRLILKINWAEPKFSVVFHHFESLDKMLSGTEDDYTATYTINNVAYRSKFEDFSETDKNNINNIINQFTGNHYEFKYFLLDSPNSYDYVTLENFVAESKYEDVYEINLYAVYTPIVYEITFHSVEINESGEYVQDVTSEAIFYRVNGTEFTTTNNQIVKVDCEKTLTLVDMTSRISDVSLKFAGWSTTSDMTGILAGTTFPTTASADIYLLLTKSYTDIKISLVAPDEKALEKISTKLRVNNTLIDLTSTEDVNVSDVLLCKDLSITKDVDSLTTIITFTSRSGNKIEIEPVISSAYTFSVYDNIDKVNYATSNGVLAISLGNRANEDIVFTFDYNLVDVYLRLFVENSTRSISKVNYTYNDVDLFTIDEIYSSTAYLNNLEYNLKVRLPYGAVLGSNFAEANIPHYEISSWMDSNNNLFTGTTITNSIYLVAVVVPSAVNVEMYYGEKKLEDIAVDYNDLNNDNRLSYGDTIILPYVIIDKDHKYTYAWEQGDFGSTISLDREENGVLRLDLVATDKYTIIFESDKFTIPSDYPSADNPYSLGSRVINIAKDSKYYINNGTTLELSPLTATEDTRLYGYTYTIPTAEVKGNGCTFKNWQTGSGVKYNNGYTYRMKETDINNNGVIVFTAMASSNVTYYLTSPEYDDPNKERVNLKATMDATGSTFNLDYIEVECTTEPAEMNNFVNMLLLLHEVSADKASWRIGNTNIYYTSQALSNMATNYTFYGWTTNAELGRCYDSIHANYSTLLANSALLYTFDAKGTSTYNIESVRAKMLEFVQSGHYTFYAVWGSNHSITYDISDFSALEDKVVYYREGVSVEFKNTDYTLDNGNKKWIGWQVSGTNTKYEFNNSGITSLIIASENITLVPYWQDGVSITFKTNFDKAKSHYAEVNNLEKDSVADPILSGSKPFTLKDKYVVSDIVTLYKDSDFEKTGAKQYFQLLGWSKNKDAAVAEFTDIYTISADDLNATDGNLIFYAVWKEVDVTVTVYYSEEDAEAGVVSGAYHHSPNCSGKGEQIILTVPYGYRLSTLDYSNKGKYVYLCSTCDSKELERPINHRGALGSKYYKLDYWTISGGNGNDMFENTPPEGSGIEIDTISSPITEDIKIYPVFIRQYELMYKVGDNQLGSSKFVYDILNKTLTDDEFKAIKSTDELYNNFIWLNKDLTSLVGNINLVKSITVNYGANATSYTEIPNYIEFKEDTSESALLGIKTITIDVELNVNIVAYIPNSNDLTSATEFGTYSIPLNSELNINKIIESTPTLSTYTVTFDGWYYFGIGANYYDNSANDIYSRNYTNKVNNIAISMENDGTNIKYSLSINGTRKGDLTVGENGIVVNLFAKFLTTVRIENEKTDANAFYDFAISNEDRQLYNITETDTYVEYKAVLNGQNPTISIMAKEGYTVANIDANGSILKNTSAKELSEYRNVYVLDNTFNSSDNLTSVRVNRYIDTNAVVDKDKVDELGYKLSIINQFTVKTTSKSSTTINFNVTYTTLNINYSYKGNVTYGEKYYTRTMLIQNSSNELNELDNTTNAGRISISISSPLYDGSINDPINYVTTYNVTYSITKIGDTVNVLLTDIPYGVTINAVVNTNANNYEKLTGWNLKEAYTMNSVGLQDGFSIAFTPTSLCLNGESKIDPIDLTLVHEINKVTTINVIFRANNPEDRWASVLEKAKIDKMSVNNNVYSIPWQITDLGKDKEYKAGDLFSDLISTLNVKYNESFNGLAETKDYKIDTIEKLMNFFCKDTNTDWFIINGNTTETISSSSQISVGADGILNIYANIKAAYLIKATHTVVDSDGNVITGLDRADIKFNPANTEVIVVKEEKNENSTGLDTIVIKAPIDYNYKFTVIPATATENHNSYHAEKWIFDKIGDDKLVAKDTGDLTFAEIYSYSDISSSNDAFLKDDWPEIHLVAMVAVDTFDIIFTRDIDANGTKEPLATVGVGYDNITGDAGKTQTYTLESLRDANKIPLFVLDNKAKDVGVTFRHYLDENSDSYGDFKYLFECWTKLDGTKVDINSILVNNNSTSSYQSLKLVAKFKELQVITYRLYDQVDDEIQTVDIYRYLPVGGFKDTFGNSYEDLLSIGPDKSELKNKLANEIRDVRSYFPGNFYVLGKSEPVTNASELDNDLIVYPGISYGVALYYQNTIDRDIEIITYGGKLTLQPSQDGYNLNVIDIVGDSISISSNNYNEYTFAGWKLYGANTLMSKGESYIFANNVMGEAVDAHYNPKIKVVDDISGRGSVSIKARDLAPYKSPSVGNFDIALTTAPSGEIINGYANKLPYFIEVTTTTIIGDTINIRRGNDILYSITFTKNPSSASISEVYWNISYELSTSGATIKNSSSITLYDSNGAITITPVIIGESVKIQNEGLYIDNVGDMVDYTSQYTKGVSTNITVYTGYSLYAGCSNTGGGITIKDITGKDVYSTYVLIDTTTDVIPGYALSEVITDIVWQYQINSEWVDIPDENAIVVSPGDGSGILKVRMKASWITFDVEFSQMNAKSANDFNDQTVNGLSIADATKITGTALNVGGELTNSKTLTLYKGELVVFLNVFGEEFYIKKINGESYLLAYVEDNMYNHGFIQLSNKNVTTTINRSYGYNINGYTFIAWLDYKQTTNVVVDMGSYNQIVNGYGELNINVSNLKSQETIENITPDENQVYKTLEYGSMTKLSLEAIVPSSTGHTFERYTYGSKVIESTQLNASLGTLGNEVKVLYDAGNTAKQFYLVDEVGKIKTTVDIYSGYTIATEYNSNDYILNITISDHFGVVKNNFTVYYQTNSADTSSVFYPRSLHEIVDTFIFTAETIKSVAGGVLEYSSTTPGTSVHNTTHIVAPGYNIIFKLDEIVNQVEFFYQIKVDNSTYSSINTSTAYLDGEANNSRSIILKVDKDNQDITFTSDPKILGINMQVSNNNKIIRYNTRYKLLGVSLKEYLSGSTVITHDYDSSVEKSAELSYSQYYLVIELESSPNSTVNLKLNLPYASDARNLNIVANISAGTVNNTSYKGYSGTINGSLITDTKYNSKVSKGEDVLLRGDIEIPTGSTLKYSNSGSIHTLTITNGNITIGTISYTLPLAYSLATSGQAFTIQTGMGYNTLRVSSHSLPTATYMSTYKVWDSEADGVEGVTTVGTTMHGDYSIMINLVRNPITIKYSNAYWEDNYSNKDALTLDNIKQMSPTSTYIIPGGLAVLSTAEELVDNESIYTHIDKSTVATPNNLKTRTFTGLKLSTTEGDAYTIATDIKGNNGGNSNTLSFPKKSTYESSAYYVANTTFNVELSTENLWYIVNIPYGAGMEDESSSITQVDFYSNSLDDTPTTVAMNREANLKLLQSNNTVDISSYTTYMYALKSTGLYTGMYTSRPSDTATDTYYGETLLEFVADVNNTGILRILAGYKYKYLNTNGNWTSLFEIDYTKFTPMGDSYAYLFTLPDTDRIAIYPVWKSFDETDFYTVTINEDNSVSTSIHTVAGVDASVRVLKGQVYTITIPLESSFNVYSSISTSDTRLPSSRTTVYSLAGYSTSGSSSALYYIFATGGCTNAYFAYQYTTTDENATISGSSSQTNMTISFTPNANTWLNPVWDTYGKTVTYTHNGNITSSYNINSSYNKVATLSNNTVTYANAFTSYPIPHLLGYTYSSSTHPSSYFAPIKDGKLHTGTNVEFELNHTSHNTYSTSHSSSGCLVTYSVYCYCCSFSDGGSYYNHSFEPKESHTTSECTEWEECIYCHTKQNEWVFVWSGISRDNKPATCTESGVNYTNCNCGLKVLSSQPVPATGHNYGNWEVETSPTCTTAGVKIRRCINAYGPGSTAMEQQECTACEREPIPAPGHTKGTPKTKDATCTEYGYTAVYCTECKTRISYEAIKPTGHKMTDTVTKDEYDYIGTSGICWKAYTNTYPKCSKCGEVSSVTSKSILVHTQTTHTYDVKTIQVATCQQRAVYEKTCKFCGHQTTTTGDYGEHVFKVTPYCITCGEHRNLVNFTNEEFDESRVVDGYFADWCDTCPTIDISTYKSKKHLNNNKLL